MKKLYYKGQPYAVMEDERAGEIIKEMESKPGHIFLNGAYLKTIHIEILDDNTLMDADKDRMKNDKFSRIYGEWINEWKMKVRQNPKIKAQNVYGFFSCYWYAYTLSRDVPDAIWKQAKERAELYFTKYSNRVLPNPRIWKHLFPEPVEVRHSKGMSQAREFLQPRIMRHLEMALDEDIEMSKKYA